MRKQDFWEILIDIYESCGDDLLQDIENKWLIAHFLIYPQYLCTVIL